MITQPVKVESAAPVSFLALQDGRKLAYRLSEGTLPGVLFLGGFRSDMNGAKALSIEAYYRETGRRCVCFDYSGHGQSSGKFIEGTIGAWKRDVIDILDHVATGANILVGSSLGAWLMLLATPERYEQVFGMVGIASAPDFTEALIWSQFTATQKKELVQRGIVYIPACEGEAPFPITRALIEEGRNHLVLERDMALSFPVRLIHGTKDQDVPWQMSMKLMERIKSPNISLELVKDGDHRLSYPAHLALIVRTVEEVLRIVC